MPRASFEKLLLWTDALGTIFGTSELAMMLHSLIRMARPERVVELGTGVGVTTAWMGHALAMNAEGHLWSVDDHRAIKSLCKFDELMSALGRSVGLETYSLEPEEFLGLLMDNIAVSERVTLLQRHVVLGDCSHFDDYDFGTQSIDLLVSDFRHDPEDVIQLLGHFLPRMSSASSIFIDSASTQWTSYLCIERICDILNAGRVPAVFGEQGFVVELDKNRTYTAIHLTRPGRESQQSTTWIKVEPADVFPHPRALMK